LTETNLFHLNSTKFFGKIFNQKSENVIKYSKSGFDPSPWNSMSEISSFGQWPVHEHELSLVLLFSLRQTKYQCLLRCFSIDFGTSLLSGLALFLHLI
jgi:hypothetical protein